MKIISKLTLAFVACTFLILAINGYLRVRRERAFFEAERARNHELIGRSLAVQAAAVWRSDGEKAAIDAIEAVSARATSPQIRWVAAGTPAPPLAVDVAALGAAPGGEPVTGVHRDPRAGMEWTTTVVPLDVAGARRGFIVLSEPATNEQSFLRSAWRDSATMAISLTLVGAVLSFVMGQWLVGTPVRLLSEKARRVGRGDFSEPVVLGHRDELGQLACEVNAMCERLGATVEQLRHADRLSTVGMLASGVAHELGTPLNVIGARARMIAEGQTEPDASRAYAGIIVGATDRMTKTIRQLLQFARRGKVRKERGDLRAIAGETLELLRPLAERRHVRLEVAPGDAPTSLHVDGGQVQQVLTNLVMNAIQAMPEGGLVDLALERVAARSPEEKTGEERECLRLRVRDEGQGIAPEHLHRVFEPFFTTKDVGEGTGLGLAVSYGIIREHGGWITVESEVGVGSTFSVYFPLSEST